MLKRPLYIITSQHMLPRSFFTELSWDVVWYEVGINRHTWIGSLRRAPGGRTLPPWRRRPAGTCRSRSSWWSLARTARRSDKKRWRYALLHSTHVLPNTTALRYNIVSGAWSYFLAHDSWSSFLTVVKFIPVGRHFPFQYLETYNNFWHKNYCISWNIAFCEYGRN